MNTNHVFSAFSCLGFILVSIPFAWHLEAWNTGTCLYMFWVGMSCLGFFINSVVWDGNSVNWAPAWCDITARLILAVNVAIPACALCIQRRLYYIITDPTVTVTKSERRRAITVDMLIGFGLPILNIILTTIVQDHRYDIFEDVGCYPAFLNTPLAWVIISLWPIVIGTFTAVYCSLNVYHFWNKRRTLKSLLQESSGSINFSRYIRLMVLCCIDILCTIPLSIWGLYSQATLSPVIPWQGWAAAHANFSFVGQIPAALWRSDHNSVVALELTRWSSVMCAILFFMFFGFADEARRHYSVALSTVARKLGSTTFAPTASDPYNSRSSKNFTGITRRPTSSIAFDEIDLPDLEKDLSFPTSAKLSPFGAPYGSRSAFTVSTSFESDSKHPVDGDSSLEVESPVQPFTPISPPPITFDPERGLRPPVYKGLNGFGGAY